MLLQNTVIRSAEQRPGSIAVVSRKETVTYGELDSSSNRLARLLSQIGVRKGDRVGLLLPKSIRAITAMLGTLKCGGIYVPMDTASPPARLARIIDICRPKCILSVNSAAAVLLGLASGRPSLDKVPVGWLDDTPPREAGFNIAFSWSDCRRARATPLDCDAPPSDPAHILFTSGSTGTPKGVVISHASVAHFIEWAIPYFGTKPSDRISCHPPLHFDLSTFDIYGTFLAGAELHLVAPEASLVPKVLAAFIRERELTQWFSVPSVLKYMAQFNVVKQGDFPALQRLLWCGEALPTPTLIYWMQRLPHVKFTNLYGPTETTIASSYYTVPACPAEEKADIPIGAACPGEELLVLDESLKRLPQGETGELYIRGAGLSPGYWKDPAKTASVFLDSEGGRMYKTGDLARVGTDGLVYLLGRTDSQIKSRGYRIELGEIEAALYTLQAVRECAVVAIPSDGFDGNAICCAYVSRAAADTARAVLRDQLSGLVPAYMMPSHWMALESLPHNANGKIDRPRVRQLFQESTAKSASARAVGVQA